MRIAIIGAGFFGHHIAEEIVTRHVAADVDIFEAEPAPLLGAGTINQCRLHMGFHYPRSGYTIYQSIMGFDRFLEKYPEYVHVVSDNLYAVHRNGFSTAEQYLAVMDSFSLAYEKLPRATNVFSRPDDIALLLRVPERSIDVRAIRSQLSRRFDGNLRTNARVAEVDPEGGRLRAGDAWEGPYDYIVNASYTDLNLGLPPEKQFTVKYELTALVLARTSLPADAAVTIMDGPFISVYPAYGGLHTLSSVVHTPFRRYSSHREFAAAFPNRVALARQDDVARRIGDHVREHLNLTYSVEDLWVTAKTKLATDKGDSRVTEVRQHKRLLSVLCGKLDAVFAASDAILKEIK